MTDAVGVVVPAFRPNVERLLAYVRDLAATLSPAAVRIELDDPDASTRRALADADLPPSVEYNVFAARRGKGAAITAGFEALSTPIRTFADADGATPADSIADVVGAVRDGADLAVGSRRHPAATVEGHQTVVRRALGDGFAWLGRRLLAAELYDYQCGAKALTADAWRRVRGHLYESGFAWDIELVAVAAAVGCRVAEIPVTWADQPGSTVAPVSDGLGLLRGLLAARHRAKLLTEAPMHELLDAGRDPEPALIERLALDADERE